VAFEGEKSPYHHGQVINIKFDLKIVAPALDPGSLCKSIEQLRSYVIQVNEDAYPIGIEFVYPSHMSHPELKRQGKIMAKEVAQGVKVKLSLDVALKTGTAGPRVRQARCLGCSQTPY
jgi:hypothetical protein